jgi:hypothetical protein
VRTAFRRVVTTLSVLFLIATIAFWIRSQKASDTLTNLQVVGPPSDPAIRFIAISCRPIAVRLIWVRISIESSEMVAAKVLVNDPADHPLPMELHSRRTKYYLGALPDENEILKQSFWKFAWNHTTEEFAPTYFCLPKDPANGVFVTRFITTNLGIPWWFLTFLFAIIPTLALYRRRARPGPGHCPQCGYDLRATPDPRGPFLSICPECGRTTVEE